MKPCKMTSFTLNILSSSSVSEGKNFKFQVVTVLFKRYLIPIILYMLFLPYSVNPSVLIHLLFLLFLNIFIKKIISHISM